MTIARFEHQGAAPSTGLAANMGAGDLSFTLTSGSGYPTGAGGKPFILVIDPNTPQEEKILCSARSGTTVTVNSGGGLGGRGFDGTIATSHNTGATNVEHVFGAIEADDANDHIYTTTRDDHTQYARTDGTRAFTGPINVTGNITSTAFVISSALTVSGGATVGTLASGAITSTGVVSGTAHSASLAGAGRYVGTTNGAPTSGTFLAGDFANDPTNNAFWQCTTGGTPGTWVQVGGTTDASWTAVSSFTNSWVNFGAPKFNAAYRLVAGRVYLRGVVKSGTVGQAAFTLPAAYRPSAQLILAVDSNGGEGQLVVNAAGTVVPQIGSNTGFGLDNCSWDTL